ncbi:hypothetical protein PIB30_078565 [Stylosanthes scabra]|uniref:Aminotransferase-like plant mobile domain-containing protein n=1 Tax=Stylosanthes scabra TaxID=79078 RepID=A0ABU6QR01_9FABA|nr:hypothetical protein [Stylosanthes scabra]
MSISPPLRESWSPFRRRRWRIEGCQHATPTRLWQERDGPKSTSPIAGTSWNLQSCMHATSSVTGANWPLRRWQGRVGERGFPMQQQHALDVEGAAWCINGRGGGDQPSNNSITIIVLQPSPVLEPYGILVDMFPSNPPDPLMDARRQMIEPYLIRSGFYYAAKIKSFQYDNPLINAFVERWRPETHVSSSMGGVHHHPRGCCDAPRSPDRWKSREWDVEILGVIFHRDIWQWCNELLG